MDDRTGLRVVKPLGRFRAATQSDASALDRDGEVFHAANELIGSTPTWEIMFGDGVWLLASPDDLDWFD